jgi:2,4-dienoyl-CoA reductase-like NADH-dependent reductase (Old Yellow Enzyme family)
MTHLFTPLEIREVNFKNRIFVAPMCQYSAIDGIANNWHLVHLGSRAVGGAALIIVEATSVSPQGRISHGDLGIWNDDQQKAFASICDFISEQGSVPGIQLAHAGRKAATNLGWLRDENLEAAQAWQVLAPSAIAFTQQHRVPKELSNAEIDSVIEQFVAAAKRSLRAGFKVLEIHMAHGYLLHEFLSPLSNHRSDFYGGSLENRMRLPLCVVEQVRKIWPVSLPVFVRISATDWVAEGGWSLNDSIELSRSLKNLGVDLIDCSSGGNTVDAKIPVGPGYQVQFAEAIKREVKILTGAVGLITEAHQADEIVTSEKADAVLIARELLRDPYWPLHAAKILGVDVAWPLPYQRAKQ